MILSSIGNSAVLVTYRITRHSNSFLIAKHLVIVLVTYRITRHSNKNSFANTHFRVLVTYRITRHSNKRTVLLAFALVLVTYRITRHSNLKFWRERHVLTIRLFYKHLHKTSIYISILTYFFIIFKYFT